MILPDKNLKTTSSMIGVGAIMIRFVNNGQTISSLWDKIYKFNDTISFDKDILVLDLLYGLNAISYKDGIIRLTNDS